MRLFPFRRPSNSPQARVGAIESSLSAEDALAAVRLRARRRLIGAAILVAVAVVGFPLVFETQPRPLPSDLPIDIPHKDALPALALGPPAAPQPVDRSPEAVAATPSSAPLPAQSPTPLPAPTTGDAHASGPPPAARPIVAPAPLPADASRARALLDGKAVPASSSAEVRYIVQIGAFADTDAVAAVRSKAERRGLKTYTQVVDTPAGRRTRVRLGPFATKAEADRALGALKSVGLSAALLTLGD